MHSELKGLAYAVSVDNKNGTFLRRNAVFPSVHSINAPQ